MVVPTVESPISAGVTLRSQVSGKLVCREACSDVSQTAVSLLTNRSSPDQTGNFIQRLSALASHRGDEVALPVPIIGSMPKSQTMNL